MPRDTSFNRVGKPHGNMAYNVEVGELWYPLQIKTDMPMWTENNVAKAEVSQIDNVGTPQAEPFDFTTLAGLKLVRAALPTWMRARFTALVIAAINEDPSA